MNKNLILLTALLMAVFHVDHLLAQQMATPTITTQSADPPVLSSGNASLEYAKSITSAELREHLSILASDAYEGRETGQPGQKKAAQFLADYYKDHGINPCVNGSYFQSYPLRRERINESYVTVSGKNFKFGESFFTWGGDWSELDASAIVFAGYGIQHEKYSDYNAQDVKGKVMMVMAGEPQTKDGKSLITGTEATSDWADDYGLKYEMAMKNGAIGMLVVLKNYDGIAKRITYFFDNPSERLVYPPGKMQEEKEIPLLFVSPNLATEIFKSGGKSFAKTQKKLDKGKLSKGLVLKTNSRFMLVKKTEDLTGENVLCFIEGSDPVLKNEIVIVSAHYDHIGIVNGQINNGADDDGSGTVSAMEIAEAFIEAKAKGQGPKRSVLVLHVSGEEKGLLGSEWYSEYPVFPRESTVCDLNIDMIGRKDADHPDDRYVYIIGSDKLSTDLHKISEATNQKFTNLGLDYTYNDPNDPNRFYYRSDHYNFAKHNIPVIFYFSGVHEDYHKPGDDTEKILFDKMETIARLVFHTAWEVANRDERLKVDVVNDFNGQ